MTISEDKYYFQFKQSGFFSHGQEPRIIADMSGMIKAFYGILISCGLLIHYSYGESVSDSFAVVAKLENGFAEICGASSVDDEIKKCSALNLSGDANDKLKNGDNILNLIQPAIDLLNCAQNQKLRTASLWLMRAYISDRDMDKILNSAICVEVLLGDRETSDRIGLSKLMANRCAYALGGSAAEREEIIATFLQWYRVRSEIVHSGRIRVSVEERRLISSGRNLAARLLSHEIMMCKT